MNNNDFDSRKEPDLSVLYSRDSREKYLGKDNIRKTTAVKGNDSHRSSAVPKRYDSKRRRNRMLANIMIYSGISILIVLCIIVSVLLFVGQNGQSITAIEFEAASLSLRAGHSGKLVVKTQPEGTEYALSFSSSDSSTAVVSADGTVNALKEGSTVITVTSGGLSASCTVSVHRDTIDSLEVFMDKISLGGGEEFTVKTKILPSDAADKNIIWKSSDEETAIVDENGTIKGIKAGEAVISVTDTVTGKSCDINVTVTSQEKAEAMEFSENNVTIEVGQQYTAQLKFTPDDITDKSAIFYTEDSSIASVTNDGLITAKQAGTCTIEAYYANDYSLVAVMEVTVIDPFVIITTEETTSSAKPETETPSVNSSSSGIQTTNGLTYIDGVLIANKTYSLPSDYNPGTDDTAYNALEEMYGAAAIDGISLYTLSGFRSYDTQEAVYNNYVAGSSREEADRYSARPGYSEHQTGLAFDLNSLDESFGDTAEGIWLAENCHRFGFIIRYPKNKEHITGYMYEPWHVRYIGRDMAQKVYNSGLTLEEYFGITSAYAD